MYCINCGVRLADTEASCPLCGTAVYHPELKRTLAKPTYPPDKLPQKRSWAKLLSGAMIIVAFIPMLVSFLADFMPDRELDWFGYVAGGVLLAYILFVLPFWFKRFNPLIFIGSDFAAIILYLLYINQNTGGEWFFPFALPVAGSVCLITCGAITLFYYLRKGQLYVLGGLFVSLGAFLLLLEFLMVKTFGMSFVWWSLYPLIVLVLLGGVLIYLSINSWARERIERKLFF